MREHPHHDTVDQLLTIVSADDESVVAELERLRGEGLVHTHAGHWQLTAAGWRVQRAA
jgi:predicted transcriptional regulator